MVFLNPAPIHSISIVGTKLSMIASSSLNNQVKVNKRVGLGLKDRLINGFKQHGLTAQDLTAAIIIHEALGIFMLAITWSLCYFVQVSTLPALKEPLAKIASIMPKAISTNEFLNSRLGVAYCESSCLRKLIRPFTLPMKIVITVKLVQLLHKLPIYNAISQKVLTSQATSSQNIVDNSLPSNSKEKQMIRNKSCRGTGKEVQLKSFQNVASPIPLQYRGADGPPQFSLLF